MLLFKVLKDGESCHGGDYKYPRIRKWTPLEKPQCCESGYHLTSDPLIWWIPGASLWLAEGKLPLSGDGNDKAAFTSVRLIQEITPEWPYLIMFPRLRMFLAASQRAIDEKADISWADLSWANLSRADLVGANLSRANLSEANLSGANLSEANLSRADLSGADLSWADLVGANLSEADLSAANLVGANLSEANLSRADLSGAIWAADWLPDGWITKNNRLTKKED